MIYENYTSETIYMIDFIILAFVLQNNSQKGKLILNHLSRPFSSTSNNVLCCLDNDLFMTDRELINSVNTSKADLNNWLKPLFLVQERLQIHCSPLQERLQIHYSPLRKIPCLIFATRLWRY